MEILQEAWRRASRSPSEASGWLSVAWEGLGRARRRRIAVIRIASLAWFGLVLLRLVDLQVMQARHLRTKAVRQQEGTVDIPARRGGILDRHGRDLALSTPAQSIGVFTDRVEDKEAFAAALEGVLGIDRAQVLQRLRRGGFQWVKRLVTLAEVEGVRALDLQHLHFETESKRYYPYGPVAAHVVGTVGLDHLGQSGIEQRFEERLSGIAGTGVLEFDARQARYGRQVVRPAVRGADLKLEIDLRLQELVHLELDRAIRETESQAGAFVLMSPQTGDILAMASWPHFDPNSPARTEEDLERRSNFALSHLVEPGSTFKVLTAAAALEEEAVSVDESFDCQMGSIWIGSRRIRDHHPYGMLTMPEVIMKSSNVGIIKIGNRLGERRMHSYIRRFGFGRATGVGLPGEADGLVRPVHRWSGSSLASLAMGQEIGVTAVQMARLFSTIANGGTIVQPRVVRSVHDPAGVETEFERALGERVLSARTSATMQAILEQVVEDGTGRLAKVAGYRVAGKTGTAQMINPETRSYVDGPYMSSFCGFAPVNDPALVGVAMLYDPRGEHYYGGRIAAPLFSAVARNALRILDVPPSRLLTPGPGSGVRIAHDSLADFAASESAPDSRYAPAASGTPVASAYSRTEPIAAAVRPAKASGRPAGARSGPRGTGLESVGRVSVGRPSVGLGSPETPDLLGLTMREALIQAGRLGIRIEVDGSGVARDQSPKPGESLPGSRIVEVRFGLAPVDGGLRAGGG